MGPTLHTVLPLLEDMHNPKFMLKKWLPFELTGKTFWLDYAWSSLFTFVGAISYMAIDCVVFAYIIQGSKQVKVLKLRLKAQPKIDNLDNSRNLNSREAYVIEENWLNPIIKQHQLIIK